MCYVKFIQYVVKSEKIVYKYRSSYWRVYGQVIISEHRREEKEAFMVDERWQGWLVCVSLCFSFHIADLWRSSVGRSTIIQIKEIKKNSTFFVFTSFFTFFSETMPIPFYKDISTVELLQVV